MRFSVAKVLSVSDRRGEWLIAGSDGARCVSLKQTSRGSSGQIARRLVAKMLALVSWRPDRLE